MKTRHFPVLLLSLGLFGAANPALAVKVCSHGDGTCLKDKGTSLYHSRKTVPPIEPEPPLPPSR